MVIHMYATDSLELFRINVKSQTFSGDLYLSMVLDIAAKLQDITEGPGPDRGTPIEV